MINLEDQYIFVPFAVETFGPFGEDAKGLINDIGRRIFGTTADKRSKSFLIQEISLAIQRGNAAAILGTFPSSSSLNNVLTFI